MLEMTLYLDPTDKRALYQQLYDSLTRQIRTGQLQAGDRLPGKRSLAAQLAVAVNTVDTAYQMLVAEGYLEARPKSGFYVLEYTDVLPKQETAAVPAEKLLPEPAPPPVRFDLSTGAVDTALFPFRTWGRIQKELLYASPELLSHGHRQGEAELREELAVYLRAYRGVMCSPEQIVVGAGVEYLLGLLAQLLRGAARRPLRTPAMTGPGPSWRTTVFPAGAWISTAAACRYRRWRRVGQTSAMSPPATTSPPA